MVAITTDPGKCEATGVKDKECMLASPRQANFLLSVLCRPQREEHSPYGTDFSHQRQYHSEHRSGHHWKEHYLPKHQHHHHNTAQREREKDREKEYYEWRDRSPPPHSSSKSLIFLHTSALVCQTIKICLNNNKIIHLAGFACPAIYTLWKQYTRIRLD